MSRLLTFLSDGTGKISFVKMPRSGFSSSCVSELSSFLNSWTENLS